jgi:predicted nuclease with TOPRIM domain
MTDNNENQGWKEWSNHVLKELERLNSNYENLRDEVVRTNQELVKTAAMKHALTELISWKKDVDKVVNEEDLKEMKKCASKIQKNTEDIEQAEKDISSIVKEKDVNKKDIYDLKTFKTKAVTAGVIVFFLLTTAITIVGWYLS